MINNIRNARKAKGLTQTELAKIVGVTQGNMSAWETGRWEPEMATLKKLCEILDCSADYLLARSIFPKVPINGDMTLSNMYMHLAKEMEDMQLPESDIEKIMDFARFMKEKNEKQK